MEKKIKIEEEMSNYIERLQYEKNARENLCAFLIRQGLSQTEDFKYYHDEYKDAYIQYEMAKKELEDKYVPKKGTRWELNFSTSEITIYED